MGSGAGTASLLAACVAACLLASPASARDREGLSFGGSLGPGLGFSDADDQRAAASLAADLHLGFALDDGVAIMLDGWGSPALEESGVVALGMVAVQIWPADRLWLRFGVGIGPYRVCQTRSLGRERSCSVDTGLGTMGAVGIELVQTRRFVVDLGAHLGCASVSIGDSASGCTVSLGLGLSMD